jgi:hypothetical protein
MTPALWGCGTIWGFIFVLQGAFAIMQFFSIIRSTALYTDGIGCHYCYASAFQCIWYCALPSAYVTVAVLSAIGVLLAFVMLLRASARTPRIKTGNDDVVYMVLKAPFALHAGWAVVQVVLTANIWALYPDKMGADAIDNQLCVAIVSLVVLICAAIWLRRSSPRAVFG